MQMKGLVTIVTGASRGLGYAIAREYGREGARVVVTSRPNSPSGLSGTADQTARDIQEAGGESLSVPCDAADEGQVKAMVEKVMDHYGQIDVLVNNAGIMIPGEPFLDIGPDRWDELMAVNVRGPYMACRLVLPVMIEQRKGSIINVGSKAASVPRALGTVYCTSKAALHMFTLCLAYEAEEYNIAVNVLEPGAMKSEGSAVIPWTRHDWDQRVMPAEVGPSAVFLALQDAKSFTGRVAVRAEFGQTWP